MTINEEQAPLLVDNNLNATIRKDRLSRWSIISGLVLFTSLIGSVLVRIPFNLFSYHPLFMTLFIVLVTEGVALLQPTASVAEKKHGLRAHALVQTVSYISVVFGFTFIFYNKVVSGKSHFESVHGKLGLFVFIYILIQLAFGITVAFVPRIYGSVARAKGLWKYHRVFGYFLLVLVWITAQLGVRADYMYNNLYSPKLIWLHWVSVFLIFGGIFGRIRFSKWGLKQ